MSLDDMLFGSKTTMKHFFLFYGVFTALGLIARWILKSSGQLDRDSSVMDFVVTFELYACELGHSYVLYRYGPQGYIFAIGAVGILHAGLIFLPVFLPGADGDICTSRLTGNPLSHFLHFMRCPTEDVSSVGSHVVIQLLAALLCHPIAVIFWKHITNECNMQYIESMHCSLIGQNCRFDEVFFLQLCAEILGSTVLTLVALQTGLAVDVACDIVKLFVVFIVLLNEDSLFAVHLNPALGLSELLSCDHVSIFRRLASYCVGPVVGVTLAVKLIESMSANDGDQTGCDRPPSSAASDSLCSQKRSQSGDRGAARGDKSGAGRFLMVKIPKPVTQKMCNSQANKTDYCATMSDDYDPCNAYSFGTGNDPCATNQGTGKGSSRNQGQGGSGKDYGSSNQGPKPSGQDYGSSNQGSQPSSQSYGSSNQGSGGSSDYYSGARQSLRAPPPRLPRASVSPSRKKIRSPDSSRTQSKEQHGSRRHRTPAPIVLADEQHNRFISEPYIVAHLNPSLGLVEVLGCDATCIYRRLAMYCVGPVLGVTLAIKLLQMISTNTDKLFSCDCPQSDAVEKASPSGNQCPVGNQGVCNVEQKPSCNQGICDCCTKQKQPRNRGASDSVQQNSSCSRGACDSKQQKPSCSRGGCDSKLQKPSCSRGGCDSKQQKPSCSRGACGSKKEKASCSRAVCDSIEEESSCCTSTKKCRCMQSDEDDDNPPCPQKSGRFYMIRIPKDMNSILCEDSESSKREKCKKICKECKKCRAECCCCESSEAESAAPEPQPRKSKRCSQQNPTEEQPRKSKRCSQANSTEDQNPCRSSNSENRRSSAAARTSRQSRAPSQDQSCASSQDPSGEDTSPEPSDPPSTDQSPQPSRASTPEQNPSRSSQQPEESSPSRASKEARASSRPSEKSSSAQRESQQRRSRASSSPQRESKPKRSRASSPQRESQQRRSRAPSTQRESQQRKSRASSTQRKSHPRKSRPSSSRSQSQQRNSHASIEARHISTISVRPSSMSRASGGSKKSKTIQFHPRDDMQ